MSLEIISQYSIIIMISASVVIIISLLMNIIALSSISKLKKKYKKMMRGKDNVNIEALINKYLDDVEKVKENNDSLMNQYDTIMSKVDKSIQKTAIIRYKAFDDVGSDLSFSLALLDSENNGVVVTSIYGRSESVVYAKPIDNGISRYDISEEEKEVLESAMTN